MSLELEAMAKQAEFDKKYPGLYIKFLKYWGDENNMKQLLTPQDDEI